MSEMLDKKEIAKALADLSDEALGKLVEYVGLMASLTDEKRYDVIPAIYKKMAIHQTLWTALNASREALIANLGGKPVGEARLRVFEEGLVKTVLPKIQIDDFDSIITGGGSESLH